MSSSILSYVKDKFEAIFARGESRIRKGVIADFAEKSGLIYFGFVDQNSDEHEVVRGFTVSPTQHDNNYCVGSAGGYNVTVVDRTDTIKQPDGQSDTFNWLIMSFELKTEYRIPHFLIGANNHDMKPFEALFSSFPNMIAADPGTFESYSPEFTSQFTIYDRPARHAEVEQFLTADITRTIGAHFWPLSVEQHDNILYVYAVDDKINTGLMDTMIENGLWLAGQLDEQSQHVTL
jgi:hypothetical protein